MPRPLEARRLFSERPANGMTGQGPAPRPRRSPPVLRNARYGRGRRLRPRTPAPGGDHPNRTQASRAAGAQQPFIQRGFWRRPDCRCRQHQQGQEHSRVQSQESLQRLAVHLRSDHGTQHRTDHHAGTARVAGVGSDTEFIGQNSPSPNSSSTPSSLGGMQSPPPAQPAPPQQQQ